MDMDKSVVMATGKRGLWSGWRGPRERMGAFVIMSTIKRK